MCKILIYVRNLSYILSTLYVVQIKSYDKPVSADELPLPRWQQRTGLLITLLKKSETLLENHGKFNSSLCGNRCSSGAAQID